jgi:hypothetical protein
VTKFQELRAKAVVVLTAAVTYITAISQAAAAILLISPAPGLAKVLGTVVAVAAGAISIIRRVTPVVSGERGLLPEEDEV